jgi:hypothetical protein
MQNRLRCKKVFLDSCGSAPQDMRTDVDPSGSESMPFAGVIDSLQEITELSGTG